MSAFLSGFATSIEMLLFLRCLVFIGVCVEFVAAVAWLAELFPEPKRREKVLGYTQAFSSLGGLMVATVNGWCVAHAASLPALDRASARRVIQNPHAPWRYTLMSGVHPGDSADPDPAVPARVADLAAKKEAGTLRRPSIAELFSPALRRTTIVTTVMFAMAYGAAFGAIQQIPQIVPGLPGSAGDGRRPAAAAGTADRAAESRRDVTKFQEIGGLAGRVVLAWLAVVIVSRRKLIRMFQVPGLDPDADRLRVGGAHRSADLLYPAIFLAGFFTVGAVQFLGQLSAARLSRPPARAPARASPPTSAAV